MVAAVEVEVVVVVMEGQRLLVFLPHHDCGIERAVVAVIDVVGVVPFPHGFCDGVEEQKKDHAVVAVDRETILPASGG